MIVHRADNLGDGRGRSGRVFRVVNSWEEVAWDGGRERKGARRRERGERGGMRGRGERGGEEKGNHAKKGTW